MKKIMLCLFLSLVFQINYAQDQKFKQDALKLIEISGATNQMKLLKNQIIKYVSKDKQKVFLKDFDDSLPQLYEDYANTYMKIYTHDDIKAMIQFYESPVGKKIYMYADEMAQRTQAMSQKWMQKLQDSINKYKLP